jgi:LPXTG-motif cell wall-anchored protein
VTTTTNPGATDSGGTTTTATPLLTETPLSTAGLTLQDLPPVRALALGEALPDPPPRVLAFVITRGNNVVVLGELSADQVRTLYRELAERRLAHTGNDTGALPLVAVLVLLSGGALLGLSRRRGAT